MVPDTRSTPYMSFKSIFYHSSFKQHYIKLYFHLFYLDHSLTVVHNMLYSPPTLWCSAYLLLHKQTLAHFSVFWERFWPCYLHVHRVHQDHGWRQVACRDGVFGVSESKSLMEGSAGECPDRPDPLFWLEGRCYLHIMECQLFQFSTLEV